MRPQTNKSTSALDSDGVLNAARGAYETRVVVGAWCALDAAPAAAALRVCALTDDRADRGSNTTSIDFGFRPTFFIGDRVWIDADGDGVQARGARPCHPTSPTRARARRAG